MADLEVDGFMSCIRLGDSAEYDGDYRATAVPAPSGTMALKCCAYLQKKAIGFLAVFAVVEAPPKAAVVKRLTCEMHERYVLGEYDLKPRGAEATLAGEIPGGLRTSWRNCGATRPRFQLGHGATQSRCMAQSQRGVSLVQGLSRQRTNPSLTFFKVNENMKQPSMTVARACPIQRSGD